MSMERSYGAATFEELSLLTTDPSVEAVKTKARELAELLNEAVPSAEDIGALTAELDSEWPYMGEHIGVTGNIRYIDPVTSEARVMYCEDQQVVSNGFFFEPVVISMDGDEVAKYYEPRHHLLATMAAGEENRMLTMGCVAGFDDIIIDYPSESMELIEKRLRHFHPMTMESVDTLLLNAENEDDATLSLASLQLQIDTTDDNDLQLLSDLQNYMTYVMEYDTELPYAIAAVDKFFIQEDSAVRMAAEGSAISGFFWPQRIQFLPANAGEGSDEVIQRFVACVAGVYMGETRGEVVDVYLEPNYLSQFISIRR